MTSAEMIIYTTPSAPEVVNTSKRLREAGHTSVSFYPHRNKDGVYELKGDTAALAALPEAPEREPWWVVLGVTQSWQLDAIEKVYRALALEYHPDRRGTDEAMARLSRAIAEARAEKGQARA